MADSSPHDLSELAGPPDLRRLRWWLAASATGTFVGMAWNVVQAPTGTLLANSVPGYLTTASLVTLIISMHRFARRG